MLTLEDLKLRKYQRIGKHAEDVENEGRRQSINKKAINRKKRVHREPLDLRSSNPNENGSNNDPNKEKTLTITISHC